MYQKPTIQSWPEAQTNRALVCHETSASQTCSITLWIRKPEKLQKEIKTPYRDLN
uniref:Uncharacterized protein n=1 Tax=Arundo donax TaxID=35708 RepID=A0A0A9E7V4_ARUDO